VVVSLVPEGERPEIEDLAKAMISPFRPIFLGRVSCPPAEPLFRNERIKAANVRSALEKASHFTGEEGGEIYAEWPAEGPGGLYPSKQVPGEVVQVPDIRDWINDIHAGSRLLARGMVQPFSKMVVREVRQ
jgi:CRISPR system Cascade subunit CasD